MRMFPIMVCLALVGCAKPEDCTAMARLNVGTSTLADAKTLLGDPSGSGIPQGLTTTYQWKFTTHSNVGGGTLSSMRLTFDQDGKLLYKDCTTTVFAPVTREPGGG